jgi:hypothetical protein
MLNQPVVLDLAGDEFKSFFSVQLNLLAVSYSEFVSPEYVRP